MSLDLTGGLLVSFILDELKPVLARHPRFRENTGEAFQVLSNIMLFRDVSVTVGNLSGESTRLSPDYYVSTARGRALVAALDGKAGVFIEWIKETDTTGALPVPGMYLLHVDTVNEATRQVRFIQEKIRSEEGAIANADGTVICVDPSIPLALVAPVDPTVQFERAGTRMWLTEFVTTLGLVRTDTQATLRPGIDWWLERTLSIPLEVTEGGAQFLACPQTLADMQVIDDTGRILRRGLDWQFADGDRIKLANWTEAGKVFSARGRGRVDPRTHFLVHPENQVAVTLGTHETLVTDSLSCWTSSGSFLLADTVVGPDGNRYLTSLLTPGDELRWDAQIASPQVYVTANKMEMTSNLIPGLNIAIGDLVEVGDQCCILVSTELMDTYQIFGGKDNVSFDITVKSNDLMTTSELAGMIERYLLIEGRNRMESAGVTVLSSPFSYQGEQRDASGTTTTHSGTLNVSAAADWEYYKPIVNKIISIDLNLVAVEAIVVPQMAAVGRSQFTTSYF